MMLLIAPEVCKACGHRQFGLMPVEGRWIDSQCGACEEMACDVVGPALPVDPAGELAARWAMTYPHYHVPPRSIVGPTMGIC